MHAVWSLTIKEEHRFRVFGSTMLRLMLGFLGNEVTEG
jgi:hypothetical protein